MNFVIEVSLRIYSHVMNEAIYIMKQFLASRYISRGWVYSQM